jgi:subtilisin-like proprotein convertase family protein
MARVYNLSDAAFIISRPPTRPPNPNRVLLIIDETFDKDWNKLIDWEGSGVDPYSTAIAYGLNPQWDGSFAWREIPQPSFDEVDFLEEFDFSWKDANNTPAEGYIPIYGVAYLGQTLSTTAANIQDAEGLGPFSYQWYRGTNESNLVALSGQTGTTYTVVKEDMNHRLQVRISFQDPVGNPEVVSSGLTVLIPEVDIPPEGIPVITGTREQGHTLSVNTSGISDYNNIVLPFSYQWQRLSDGEFKNIPAATSSTYSPIQADVYQQLRVRVSYNDGIGTYTEIPSEPVSIVNSNIDGGVSITGTRRVGQVLTADVSGISDPNGIKSFSYQWSVSTHTTVYQQQEPQEPVYENIPARILTLSASSLLASELAGVEGTIQYQWYADGSAITGETSESFSAYEENIDEEITVTATYGDPAVQVTSDPVTVSDDNLVLYGAAQSFTIRASDQGRRFRVVVTVTDVFDETNTTSSISGIVNYDPTGVVTITGFPGVGSTLTAARTIGDSDGVPEANTFFFQWDRRAPFVTLTGQDRSGVEYQTDVPAIFSEPTESGERVQSSVLTDYGLLTLRDALATDNGISPASLNTATFSLTLAEYQPIAGANQQTFTIRSIDFNYDLRVRATYVDRRGFFESLASTTTFVQNTTPTGLVISGTPQVRELLTANIGAIIDPDVPDTNTFSYVWSRKLPTDDEFVDISGTNSQTYEVRLDDIRYEIRVTATYTDGFGTVETITSPAVTVVNTLPQGAATITGTNTILETLTLSIATIYDANEPWTDGAKPDWSFNYQWTLDGVPIEGESGTIAGDETATYVVRTSDSDKNIAAVVSYTDGAGFNEVVTSANVFIPNEEAVGDVIVFGADETDPPKEREEFEILTVDASDLSDANLFFIPEGADSPFTYRWHRNGSPRSNQAGVAYTGTTYEVASSDVGSVISCAAYYVDGAGVEETVFSNEITIKQSDGVGIPIIVGEPKVDETLTATTSNISDNNGIKNKASFYAAGIYGSGAYSFDWIQGGFPFNTETGITVTGGAYFESYYWYGVRYAHNYSSGGSSYGYISTNKKGLFFPGYGTYYVTFQEDIEFIGLSANKGPVGTSGGHNGSLYYQEEDGTEWKHLLNFGVPGYYPYGTRYSTRVFTDRVTTARKFRLNFGGINVSTKYARIQFYQRPKRSEYHFDYQWYVDGTAVAGETVSQYVPRYEDFEKEVTVEAIYTDFRGETNTSDLSDPFLITQRQPERIFFLYASDLLDLTGVPEGTTISYQWYADGEAIVGETADSFRVTQLYVGKEITVAATYFLPVTLYASNLLDLSGIPEGATISYQWYADGAAISGATNSFLYVTEIYAGVTISVAVSYVDPNTGDSVDGGTSGGTVLNPGTDVSEPDVTNDLTPSVEVQGVFEEGETLTIVHDIDDPDGFARIIQNGNQYLFKDSFEYGWPDVLPDAEFDPLFYQWYLNGTAISGATEKTFLIPTGAGYPASSISASVTYVDNTGDASDIFTSPSVPIRAFPTGTVNISGLPETTRTLTANAAFADLNGLPNSSTYQYQWYYSERGADIVATNLLVHLDASLYSGGEEWLDVSGNENNAIIVNSPTHNVDDGGSFSDFTSGYLKLANSDEIRPDYITLAVWAYADDWTSTTYRGIVSKTQAGGYNLQTDTTGVNGSFYISGSYSKPVDSPAPGWHHIVGTYDGTNAKLYIDGVLVDTVARSGTLSYSGSSSTNDLIIGGDAAASGIETGHEFLGKIASVAVYDRALTAEEVEYNFKVKKERFLDPVPDVEIPGATSQTYVVAEDYYDDHLKARITYTDLDGYTETVLSQGFHIENSPTTGTLQIDGTPEQTRTLTANTDALVDPNGIDQNSFTYEWYRENEQFPILYANELVDLSEFPQSTEYSYAWFSIDKDAPEGTTPDTIPNQSASSLQTPPSVIGKDITVQVSYTYPDPEDPESDIAGSLVSEPVSFSIPLQDPDIPTYSNSWQVSDEKTYEVTADDVYHPLRVYVGYTDLEGNQEPYTTTTRNAVLNASTNIVNSDPVGVPVITVNTDAEQGSTLSADLSGISDLNGIDTNSFVYVWNRSGTPAATNGAKAADPDNDAADYVISIMDVGQDITLTVTYTDLVGESHTLTTAAVSVPNSTPQNLPLIEGTMRVGDPISVNPYLITDRNYIRDLAAAMGPINTIGTFTIVIPFSLDSSIPVIGFRYTGRSPDFWQEHPSGTKVEIYDEGAWKEIFYGTSIGENDYRFFRRPTYAAQWRITFTKPGRSIQTSGFQLVTDQNATEFGTFSYQWKSDGLGIPEASDREYIIEEDYYTTDISVSVSYYDALGQIHFLESPARLVDARGFPTIDGTAEVGLTVTANTSALEDLEGVGAFSYQWMYKAWDASEYVDIAGETNNTLVIPAGFEGALLKVRVSYNDLGNGDFETATTRDADARGVRHDVEGAIVLSRTSAVVGDVVIADTTPFLDKNGRAAAADTTYSWYRDGQLFFSRPTSAVYVRPVTFENESSDALTDYVAEIVIDTATLISEGKLRSDCLVRIIDAAGALVPYWLEGPTNSSITSYWVKFANLPVGSTTLYVQYTAEASFAEFAGTSDGLFSFIDEFDSDLDPAVWDTSSSSNFAVSDGNLVGSNTSDYLLTTQRFNTPVVVRAIVNTTSANTNGFTPIGFWNSTSDQFTALLHVNTTYYRSDSSWSGSTGFDGSNVGDVKWEIYRTLTQARLVARVAGAATYDSGWVNNELLSGDPNGEPLFLGSRGDRGYLNQTYAAQWRSIHVRPYVAASEDITVTLGEEQAADLGIYQFRGGEANKDVTVRVTYTDQHGYDEAVLSDPIIVADTPLTGVPVIDGSPEQTITLVANVSGMADPDLDQDWTGTTEGLVLFVDAGRLESYRDGNAAWYDLSGQVNHASLTNITFSENVLVNEGTGTIQVASNSDSFMRNTFTHSMWVRFIEHNSQSYNGLFWAEGALDSLADTKGTQFLLALSNPVSGAFRYRILNEPTGWAETITPSTGIDFTEEWNHVAWTFDDGITTIYLNGQEFYTDAGTPSARGAYSGEDTAGFYIGSRGDGSYRSKAKYLNVLCYDRALSAEEIAANYAIDQGRFFEDGTVQNFFEQAVAYEWRRDGVPITLGLDSDGQPIPADSQQYTVTATDVYTDLTVNVSYTDAGGAAESVTSAPVSVFNSPPEGQLLIFGLIEEGETIGVETSLLSDKNGLPNEFDYQWFNKDVAIPGATQSFLTLTSQYLFKLTVRVSYVDGVGERHFVSKDVWGDSGLSQSQYSGYFDDSLAAFELELPQGSQNLTAQGLLVSFDANDVTSVSNGYWIDATGNTDAVFVDRQSLLFEYGWSGSINLGATGTITTSVTATKTGSVRGIFAYVYIQGYFGWQTHEIKVTVIAPSGASSVIWNRSGSAGALNQTFDITSAFVGEDLAGVWTLQVEDQRNTGLLQSSQTKAFTISGDVFPDQGATPDSSTTGYDLSERSLSPETIILSDSSAVRPTEALTVEMLVYQATWSISSRQDLVVEEGYSLYVQNSTLYATLRLGENTRTISVPTAVMSAGWHIVAITFDGQLFSLFVDGARYAEYDEGAATQITYALTDKETLTFFGTLNPWTGKVASLRIYDTALSNAALLENANYEVANNSTKTLSFISRQTLVEGSVLSTSQIQNTTSTANKSNLWLGYFFSPYSGTYTFYTNSSDSSYFWIGDNALSPTIENALVSNPANNTETEVSAEVELVANQYNPVRLVHGSDSSSSALTFSFKGDFALTQLNIAKTTNGAGYFFGGAYIASVLNDSPPTGQPVIVGSPEENQTLTVDLSGISEPDGLPNDFTYQWYKDGEAIYLETGATYTVPVEDIGSNLSIVVAYIDNGGVPTFIESPPATVFNSPPLGVVTVSGTPKSGNTLIAGVTNLSDPNDLGIFSFQWYRDNQPIEGATTDSYDLIVTDAGSDIFIRVQYTDGAGKLETVDSTPITILTNAPTGSVTVTGRAQVGYTLTGFVSLQDADGLGEFSYNWLRNGQVIENATDLTYTLTESDANTLVRLQVSYIDGGNTLEVVQSLASTVLPLPEFNVVPAAVTSSEGVSLTVTVQTLYVVDPNETYYWSLFGLDEDDINGGVLQGSGVPGLDEEFSFGLAFVADGLKEGTEVLEIRLYSNAERTQQLANAFVDIEDTSFNTSPVLAGAQDNLETFVDLAFSATLAADLFTDVNTPTGDVLTYSTSLLPSWLAFDATTRTFSGTPRHADVGEYTVQVTVTDDQGETASTTFSITVKPRFADSFEYGWPETLPDANYQPTFATPAVSDSFSDIDGWPITVYLVAESFENWPDFHFLTDSFEPATGW